MSRVSRTGRYDKPVPEPHFIPGYTGHCPDLHTHIGMTYPWATYVVLEEKPSLAKRLSPIKAPVRRLGFAGLPRSKGDWTPEEEDDRIIQERRDGQEHPLLGTDITIGYRGHVPKMHQVVGKTHQAVMRESIAEFERQQQKERGDRVQQQKERGDRPDSNCCCSCCCCGCRST